MPNMRQPGAFAERAINVPIHAALYVRQSSARQNRSEASPATQLEHGQAEARRRGAASVDVYEDIGVSAFRDVERPDFERMLADCRAGRRNMIIVYYVSRFSRKDPLDAIPVVTELLNLGVTIVSVTEGEFRRGNLMDLIHLIMRLDAAHNESKNKSVGVRDAKELARSLGGYVGGKPPFGFKFKPETAYTPDGKPVVIQKLVHHPVESEIVRKAWARIKEHMHMYVPAVSGPGARHPGSLSGVCHYFNESGVPTRGQLTGKRVRDSRWDPAVLRRILRDPRIAGYGATPVYKRGPDGSRRLIIETYRIDRDENGQPLTLYEPIIPPKEWWELQQWLAGRGRGTGLSRGTTLLSGLDKPVLFCECGSRMKSTGSGAARSYMCGRRQHNVRPAGVHKGTVTIRQAPLDEYVARRIFALLETAEGDEETLAILAEAANRFGKATESPETAQERAEILADRADAVQALEELYADRRDGGYRGEVGRRAFREAETLYTDRIEALDARLAELDATQTPSLPLSVWLEHAGDPIGPGSWWDRADMADRRAFVRYFVEQITVTKSHEFHGRWPDDWVAKRVTIEWVRPKGDAEDDAEDDADHDDAPPPMCDEVSK